MREIDFRGKTETGEWVYGSLYTDAQNECYIIRSKDEDPSFEILWVDSDTVGQFTGAWDSNDHKIYEGDILANEYGDTVIASWGYDELTWFAHAPDDDEDNDILLYSAIDFKGFKTIKGNIFDNGETR